MAVEQIKIKPVERDEWGGMPRYPKCKDSIAPYLSPKGGVETGLTKEDQKRLEDELKMEPGALGRTSSFWTDYKIFMDDKEKIIYTDTPEGELAYLFIKNHKRVANSVAERNEWPYADYIIFNEEEEAENENAGLQLEITALAKFNALSPEQKRSVLKLYGKRTTSSTSDDLVYNSLAKFVKEDPQGFLDKAKDPHLATRVLIEDLLSINAIRKSGTNFIIGEEVIGFDTESCIIYLEDIKNQSMLIALKKQLESKSKPKK